MKVAIDGPASAGKSTVAKRVADVLAFLYLDTGAMYRALTYGVLKQKIDVLDEVAVNHFIKTCQITFETSPDGEFIFLNQEDVTQAIRQPEVSKHVSQLASYQQVREILVRQQQVIANDQNIVMDGRDIGTVVLPDAEVKIFLVASAAIRAKRRHLENLSKGIESSLTEIEAALVKRDAFDSSRAISPLTQAQDAHLIDTSDLTIDEVVAQIVKIVKETSKS